MSVESFGVDADFVEGVVTPFVLEEEKIFQDVEKEIPKEPRGGTALKGSNTSGLGPEKGRVNRLHGEYVASPTPDNLNLLLAEVEIYARRVTVGKGRIYLHQSVTKQYAASEISSEVMIKVWRNLSKFDGRSKFSSWVFRVAQNVLKDKCRTISNRRESSFLEWKDYGKSDEPPYDKNGLGPGRCSRTVPGESTDADYNVSEGYSVELEDDLRAPDERKDKLEKLLELLSPQDKELIDLVVDESYTPRELGEKFGKNAKWASNALNRIKKQLKKLAEESYPAEGVAKITKSNVFVMKATKNLPASQAA